MKTFRTATLALAVSAIAVPSVLLAQQGGMQQGGMQQNGMQQPTQGNMQQGDDKAMGMKLDKHFAKMAGHTNHFEIEAAKYVQGKTQDPQIKQFAQQMIDDHTQAQEKLKQAAQQANAEVPDAPSEAQKAMLDEMKQLDGKLLDGQYVLSQVGGHAQTVLLFQMEAAKGQNQQLKQLAQMLTPKLQHHLEMAKGIAEKMAGGSGAGGTGGMSGSGAMDHGNATGAAGSGAAGAGTSGRDAVDAGRGTGTGSAGIAR